MTEPPMGLPIPRGERASAVPMVVVALVIVASLSGVVARMGSGVGERARADVFADSVALAAAAGGLPAGRAVAAANGVAVVDMESDGEGVVRVTIDHRGQRATAAAAVGGTR